MKSGLNVRKSNVLLVLRRDFIVVKDVFDLVDEILGPCATDILVVNHDFGDEFDKVTD